MGIAEFLVLPQEILEEHGPARSSSLQKLAVFMDISMSELYAGNFLP